MKNIIVNKIKSYSGLFDALFDLELIESRLYLLKDDVHIRVSTDKGVLTASYQKGFIFDGRSGPRIVDFYTPNLGTITERLAWLLHDGLGYGTCLTFKATNVFLKRWLRDICNYRPSKAWIIEKAVSVSSSWFGIPSPDDKYFKNLGLINLVFKEGN